MRKRRRGHFALMLMGAIVLGVGVFTGHPVAVLVGALIVGIDLGRLIWVTFT